MQDIYYKALMLTFTNIEIVKTTTSFLAWAAFYNQ